MSWKDIKLMWKFARGEWDIPCIKKVAEQNDSGHDGDTSAGCFRLNILKF